jgi:hypothetical protein
MHMNFTSFQNVSVSRLHNGFTDIVQWQGVYYCAFREGSTHGGYDGCVVVLISSDRVNWQQVATISSDASDTRDPKFLATDDRLFVYCPVWDHPSPEDVKHVRSRRSTVVSETIDGRTWSDPVPVYEPGWAFWRPVHGVDAYYAAAYEDGSEGFADDDERRFDGWNVKLLRSVDARTWEQVSVIASGDGVNETALYAGADGRLIACVRRERRVDGKHLPNLLCMSMPPYAQWSTIELNKVVQGPGITIVGGHLVIGGRSLGGSSELIDNVPHMALHTLKGGDELLKTIAYLPSWGDCSYPGFVPLGDTSFMMSYYSSQEGIAQVYIAEIELGWDD